MIRPARAPERPVIETLPLTAWQSGRLRSRPYSLPETEVSEIRMFRASSARLMGVHLMEIRDDCHPQHH
jgi:hypothetical protein